MPGSDTEGYSEEGQNAQRKATLANIRIVLIETSHPGNIGSAARAMKTMGLSDLCLVSPRSFPDSQATTLAAHAEDILEQATVVTSLEQAIADCYWVVGTSARHLRSLKWEGMDSRQCGEMASQKAQQGKVALLFGRERNGLSNAELMLCHKLVNIPGNPDYHSLNLASAVQILAYECHFAALAQEQIQSAVMDPRQKKRKAADQLVTSEDLQGYFRQLESMMIDSRFLDPSTPGQLMARLRRLYGKSRLTRSELNLLHGMLNSFRQRMK